MFKARPIKAAHGTPRSFGVAVLVWLVLGATCASAQTRLPEAWFFPDRPEGLKAIEGKPAPSLKLKAWIGEKTGIPESKGKVVVIDFWATWCGPCMAAVPKNIEIVKKYKDQGLVFIGVHDSASGWDEADKVVSEKKINYSVARDDDGGPSAKAFGLAFWPTYVVIDRKGIVRGAGLAPGHVEEAVKLLLAEAGSPDTPTATGPPDDWFFAGAARPASFRAAEGKPLPELQAQSWRGDPVTPSDIRNRVLVLHFLAPGNDVSMQHGAELAAMEKDLAPQGVMFLGVCPAHGDWAALEKASADGKAPSRLCREVAKEVSRVGEPPTGTVSSALGVKYLPATIIVDRAGVVRAAGVKPDKVRDIVGRLLAESTKAPTGG